MRIRSILLASLMALPVYAQGPARFSKLPDGSLQNFKPAVTPLGLGNGMITVVVELSGDPVALVSANAATALTREQRQQMRSQIKAAQAPIEQQLRSRGATVLASYQSAYNGVKVRVAASKARDLATIPGVVAVHPLQLFKPDNTHGVPLVGGPATWGGSPAFRGERIKVAIIDTGIDYTHADFGGPGTAAAYTAAHGNEAAPADASLFGPGAPKVKGGIDLVGDSYNADPNDPAYQPVPHPDSNPLDCNGHGSHVSGTVAGFGVLADGSTFHGPYNADTISSHAWTVGPGVAPLADLYAVRVFGCAGSTDVTVDAIEWAVANDMDVINMSLGSPFGSADEPSAVASTNAAKSGVIVVASAGNSGTNPYLVGSPSTGRGAISVAASDPTATFPGADLKLSDTKTVQAIVANGAAFADTLSLQVKVLKTGTGAVSLGCDPAEYVAAGVAGKVVVTARGTCARVARAVFGQKAGAAAVIMINNATSFPPFEGKITGNPDTGEEYTVTIPFFGVRSTDGAALAAADGATISFRNRALANPGFLGLASFTSGGPRSGDSALKPEVTAPGVSIFSVGMGTGNEAVALSGTSMAAPHTTGVAALTRQAHPDWRKVQYWKAAVVNTASPAGVAGYSVRNAGAGLVQAQLATRTQVVALAGKDTPVLNFGFAELGRDFRSKGEITLKNFGNTKARFTVTTASNTDIGHSVHPQSSQVTVPAHGEVDVDVELSVPAATAGDSSAFTDVSGLITFTPAAGNNNGVSLNVPYYFVPQAISRIETRLDGRALRKAGSAAATVTNRGGAIAGAADWYAWGLADKRDHGLHSNDLRAVGVQTFPLDGVLAFAISTNHRWSNAAANEFDIYVDVDGDGTPDYDVVGVDFGAITAGSFDGRMAVAVFPLHAGGGSIQFLADAPKDSSTLVLPVLFSQLCTTGNPCLSSTANPRFNYWVQSFGLTDGTSDTIDATAGFNPFTPSISTGMFDVVAPGASAGETVSIDAAEWAKTPALGLMIVSHDNAAGADEAQLIKVDGN